MRLIDTYFEERKGVPWYAQGAICYAPCGYILERIYALRCDNPNPADIGSSYFSLREVTRIGTIEDPLFHHPPYHALSLRKNEEFVINKYKERYVIILSLPMEAEDSGRFPECFLCAPIYTLSDKFGNPKYPEQFIKNLMSLKYNSLFYLPGCNEFLLRNSFVRFDRLQVIYKNHLQPKKFYLTDDALTVLYDWFNYYLTGKLEEYLREYRDAIQNKKDV